MRPPRALLSGWTFKEAIQRCVQRTLLAQRDEARGAWIAAGAPRRFINGLWNFNGPPPPFFIESQENFQKYKKCVETHQETLRDLKNHLLGGRLIAWAFLQSRLSERKSIPAAAWKGLNIDVQQSNAEERTPAKTQLFDVRLYPTLEAPDAAAHLTERTLVDVCRELVFADPQVAVRREVSILAGGKPATLGYVRHPYNSVWPVTYGQRRTWSSPVGFLNSRGTWYRPTRVADLTLEKRFARLIKFLADGDVVAQGTVVKSGVLVEIPRSYWTRPSSYVDLSGGDLLELDRHANAPELALSPIFLGLMLRKTASNIAREARPIRVSIRNVVDKDKIEADCALWLADLMRKSRDRRSSPKPELRKRAIRRWRGKLSGHAFDRAWSKAVDATGALAWKAAGAPQKSLQRKSSR